MAVSNEGKPEPRLMPLKPAEKNQGLSPSQSAPEASAIFKGPKQEYSGVMASKTNKKAGGWPRGSSTK